MTARRARLECCRRLVPVLLSWLVASAAITRAVQAEGAAQPQAIITLLVLEDPSTDWGRRVRGQLSDLPARADVEVARTLEGEAPIRASRALTAWITTGPDAASRRGEGTFIAIWFAGSEKPSTRRIAADWRGLSDGDRSAALELAALSVRGAVRSLLLDRTAVDAATTAAPARAREPAPEAAGGSSAVASAAASSMPASVESAAHVAERATDIAERTTDSAERATLPAEPEPGASSAAFPLQLGLELGAAWQFYGRTALGAPGARAGVQLLGSAWGLELIGQYGWPVTARIGPAAFDLRRHAAFAELSLVALDFDAGCVRPLLRAGLTWLRREGARGGAGDTPLRASGDESHRSPFVGAGAIVEQRLGAALSLSLRGVLNVETAIPTFTLVDISGARVSSGSPWSVQPAVEIGANWRW